MRSNASGSASVAAIDFYIVDGQVPSLGHRRWILSEWVNQIGVGSVGYSPPMFNWTGYASCLWVIPDVAPASTTLFRAWPPPGPVPAEILRIFINLQTLDTSGWSIQSWTDDLQMAKVSVLEDGVEQAVDVTALAPLAEKSAIRIKPAGWSTRAGHSYHVDVTGVVTPFSYDFQPIECN
jgi:hypothetical protein